MSLQAKIDAQRKAGWIVAKVLRTCAEICVPGTLPTVINLLAHNITLKEGARPSILGYRGFPASICVSVNDGVVHGIPTDVPFKDGDLVKLDFACCVDGYHADAALTLQVGRSTVLGKAYIQTAYKALMNAVARCHNGASTQGITQAIQAAIKGSGLQAVHGLSGHGIGRDMHMSPHIHNYHHPVAKYQRLRLGQTIAVEPILAVGTSQAFVETDGWTLRTKNGMDAVQVEHTVLINETGPEILTPWDAGIEKLWGFK